AWHSNPFNQRGSFKPDAMGSQSSSSSPSPTPPGDGRNTRNPRKDADSGGNYVAVARGSDLVVIRVVGKGNLLNAPALADFAEEQRRAGFKRSLFVVTP